MTNAKRYWTGALILLIVEVVMFVCVMATMNDARRDAMYDKAAALVIEKLGGE